MQNFSYYEPTEALNNRIEAHKKYSNFSLEEYLTSNFDFKDANVLDIGCGNGNFTPILSENANLYIGVEQNNLSLQESYQKNNIYKNVIFIEQDMDKELFLPNENFDYIFFIFSSYYTNNSKKLFSKMKDLLKPNGKIIIIGPTINNAKEIDDFCDLMFNKTKPSEIRAKRIEDEFVDVLKGLSFDTSIEKLNFDLQFPSYNEYIKYLKSTLQYRMSFNGLFDEKKSEKIINDEYKLKLTKEIIVLCATK